LGPFLITVKHLKTTFLDAAKVLPNSSRMRRYHKAFVINILQSDIWKRPLRSLPEYGAFQAAPGAFQPMYWIKKGLPEHWIRTTRCPKNFSASWRK
jgi:hypothetical protein